MRVLILGVTGMLGSAIHRRLASSGHEVWGTLRSAYARRHFDSCHHPRLIENVDVTDEGVLTAVMNRVRPDVTINAIGVIKQLSVAENPLVALPVNAMFPHRLAVLCDLAGSRMIQVSSDCVYSGRTGNYVESDPSDAEDLYGKSKYMGEIRDQSHVITLRTSIIGHELDSKNSLLDWFLCQHGSVRGFSRAIFSGLPSDELASVIEKFVLPNNELCGLYHVSARPISKLELLTLIARVYEKTITIYPDDSLSVDRSLDSTRFRMATGYVVAEWPTLVTMMHENRP